MNELTHLDLFSGIGGFALAAKWAGFLTIGFSEVEPYACRVLAERFPGVPNLGDVRKRESFAGLGHVTVLTGGYPCQPFSLAGKRGGKGDDRHLWPAMRDIIEIVRPSWVIGENVFGHVSMGLDTVCADLEALGYAVQPFVIPACAVDARHKRERLWIVAHAGHMRGRNGSEPSGAKHAETILGSNVPNAQLQGPQGRGQSRQSNCGSGETGSATHVAASVGDNGTRTPLADADSERGRVRQTRREDASDARQSSGCEAAWQPWLPEPAVGRVAHGIPNRAHRLKGLGNAIVPQVAEPFFRWIAQIERGEII